MDELDFQSVPPPPDATDTAAGDSDAAAVHAGPSAVAAAGAAIATTMSVASSSSSADVPTRKRSVELDVIVQTPCDARSPPDSSCAAPLSWTPASATAAESSRSRPTETTTTTREVHHVTFAEPCNKYVHSDSGIVLSPDDSDTNDVTVDGQSTELTDDDDECEEATGGQVHWPAPTNALPGPPIIKLHRCRSNESQDNPFLSDGELSRKADYIIAHSTILRTYVRIADPDQIPVDQQRTPSDTELHLVTASNATESQVSELTAEGVGQAGVSRDTPSATPQRVTSKELSAAVRNGEAEEPLLVRKKEEKSLEGSPKKNTRSKKQICCVVQ